jgi:ABC-type sugar transport system permease subunit
MLFDENVGLFNELLVSLGLEKVPWLTSTKYSRIPVIMLNVWRNTPWFTMIVFSGLLNIPRDYYEAATVDGANKWKQFFYITRPSLSNILFFCSITLTVDSWKIFNESYILPGPGTSNTSLFQYMYESGFNIFNMGYASAIGVILIVILAVISMIQMTVKKRQGEL